MSEQKFKDGELSGICLDRHQRQRAELIREAILDDIDSASFEIIGLRDAVISYRGQAEINARTVREQAEELRRYESGRVVLINTVAELNEAMRYKDAALAVAETRIRGLNGERSDDKRDIASVIAHLRAGDSDGQDHDDAADHIERSRSALRDLWRLDPKEECPDELGMRVKGLIGGG